MPVLVLPKRLAVADGVFFEEVVVHRNEAQIGVVARRPLEAVDSQCPVVALHEVLRAVVDTRPQHLQLSVHHRPVAGPVEVLLVDVAVGNLRGRLLPLRMAEMGAGIVVARRRGVRGVHVIGQPHEVGALVAGESRLVGSLHHDGVSREVAVGAGPGAGVHAAVEAVVERPEQPSTGQLHRLHAVAAVPAQGAGEQLVVQLVLINIDVVVRAVVGHPHQVPVLVDCGHGEAHGVRLHLAGQVVPSPDADGCRQQQEQ